MANIEGDFAIDVTAELTDLVEVFLIKRETELK